MKNNQLYMLVSNDKLELPCAIGDTLKELSALTGISFTSIWDSYRRKQCCYHKRYRVIKVEIVKDVDEYDFNFDDYLRYCDLHNLKPCKFSSLDKFKKYATGC